MTTRPIAAFGALVALLFAPLRPAAAEPLVPGQVLRMTFDLEWYPPPNFPVPLDLIDMLEFHPGVDAVEPVTSYTVQLFDRRGLLGSYTGDPGLAVDLGYPPVAAAFKKSTSQFTRGNPTIVDFTTITDGSIRGAVELRIADGRLDVRRITDEFGLEETIGDKDIGAQATFTATSLEIVPTPEPQSLLLIGAGVVGLATRRRRARRRRDAPVARLPCPRASPIWLSRL